MHECIVGAHGAAFTNIIFCKEGAQIIEIFAHCNGTPTFMLIAKSLGLIHHTYIAEAIQTDHINYPNLAVNNISFIKFMKERIEIARIN